MNKAKQLIDRLEAQHSLSIEEYEYLIENQSDELAAYAAEKAVALRKQVYGTDVYIRGLIEIGNICRNDCYYCGIRRSNPACDRYRLTEAQILDCAREGYALGFRTFVMQGGEDSAFSVDVVCHLVRQIKAEFPDCAVTLSLGDVYKRQARHHPAGRPRARTAGWCKRSDAQSVSAWGAKKICTVRRQTMYRRGGCTVHRLPVAPCGVGRLPDCYRTRRHYPISDTF